MSGGSVKPTTLDVLCGIDARAKLVFLAVFMLVTLHAFTPVSVGACVAVALVLAFAVRLDARTVRMVLLPLAPILVFTAIMQVASIQEGEAAIFAGGFAVTWDALAATGRMVACLFALVLASVSFMKCTSVEDLLSMLRWLLSPLRRLGVRTDAFVLSLSVAMGFAPVLVGEFQRLHMAQQARLADFDGPLRARLHAYARLFAPLLHSAFHHADNLADAFLARGFSCISVPTSLHPGQCGTREIFCLVVSVVLIVIAFV